MEIVAHMYTGVTTQTITMEIDFSRPTELHTHTHTPKEGKCALPITAVLPKFMVECHCWVIA